ncbi:MAG TPA: DUF11 domain-containing protein [Gaiellaceae bacterium]|nr:DUF11 domain-containing protein [Gaiellaceae bacterium]
MDVLRQAIGLGVVGGVGLLLAVAAFGQGPPPGKGPPPCHGHAPCPTTTVTTTVSDTTTVANTTTVASTTTVPGAPPPRPQEPTPPTVADVSVSVTAPTGIVFASDDVTYTVVIANAGPAIATGVRLVIVPARSRLLAAVAGSLGTLAPGASATTTVTLVPDAAGTMSATATASADEPDPAPANNVAVVSTPVVAGHAGPPGLQLAAHGALAPPLFALRSGGGWVVNTKVHVDEPATVTVRVVGRSGKQQTMLPGTLVDYLPAMRRHASIPHVLDAAAWLPLRIKIGGASGRSYRIVVQATGPDGSVASTNISFRTP